MISLPTPLLIDTDPGLDDAFAIALALGSPEVDVIGITTVGGNTGLANTTRNALRLLEFLGRTDIPVASGHDTPYRRPKKETGYAPVHGLDGFVSVNLPDPVTALASTDAAAFLAEKIEASPEPVTLVAIGPLTNIAHLVDRFPEVLPKVGRFIIMGGAAHLGNVTPVAEFNIWHDPEAAKVVFASALKTVMVGLDVTHSVKTYESEFDWFADAGKFGEVFGTMLKHYTDFYSEFYGERMTHQHDALAMAEAIWPGILELEETTLDVETKGEITDGMTVIDPRDRSGRGRNGWVAWSIDGVEFHGRLGNALRKLAEPFS